jgi:hypothetical protein
MTNVAVPVVLSLGVLFPTIQAKPDFNGKWMMLTTTETGPSVVRELEVQYQADKGVLTVSRRLSGPAYTDKYTLGSTGGTTVPGPRGPMTKGLRYMGWEGNVLVIADVTSITRDQDSGREERWSLDAQGRLRTVVTVWSPGGDPKTITVTYIKRSIDCDDADVCA